jgi:hypothetical protein
MRGKSAMIMQSLIERREIQWHERALIRRNSEVTRATWNRARGGQLNPVSLELVSIFSGVIFTVPVPSRLSAAT